MVSKCIFHVQYRPPSFIKTCINIEHVFSRSYVGFQSCAAAVANTLLKQNCWLDYFKFHKKCKKMVVFVYQYQAYTG